MEKWEQLIKLEDRPEVRTRATDPIAALGMKPLASAELQEFQALCRLLQDNIIKGRELQMLYNEGKILFARGTIKDYVYPNPSKGWAQGRRAYAPVLAT